MDFTASPDLQDMTDDAPASPVTTTPSAAQTVLKLVGEGLSRRQAGNAAGVKVVKVDAILRAAGLDPAAVPLLPVAQVAPLCDGTVTDVQIAARFPHLVANDVKRIRDAHGLPGYQPPRKSAPKHRPKAASKRDDPAAGDGKGWCRASEYDRFVAALCAGGERFTDDPRAIRGPLAGLYVVIGGPVSRPHSGGSSSLSWSNW